MSIYLLKTLILPLQFPKSSLTFLSILLMASPRQPINSFDALIKPITLIQTKHIFWANNLLQAQCRQAKGLGPQEKDLHTEKEEAFFVWELGYTGWCEWPWKNDSLQLSFGKSCYRFSSFSHRILLCFLSAPERAVNVLGDGHLLMCFSVVLLLWLVLGKDGYNMQIGKVVGFYFFEFGHFVKATLHCYT